MFLAGQEVKNLLQASLHRLSDLLTLVSYNKHSTKKEILDYGENYQFHNRPFEACSMGFTSHVRILPANNVITTFDIRMTNPNEEPVMNTAEVHTIEHLGATFLRNHRDYASKTLYFGPMGCRTGFYLLLVGDYESKDIVPLMKEMFAFIADFNGDVPGAAAKDCGNYLDMNLPMANYMAKRYLTEVLENITEKQLVYPE